MRWLLTYSDLVTLLMVFFILMYSIANVDVEKYRGLAQALHGRLGRPDAAVPIPTVVLAAESAAEGELLGPPLPPEPEPEPAPGGTIAVLRRRHLVYLVPSAGPKNLAKRKG